MNKIVVATNNSHKLKEIKEILKGYEILSLKDIDFNDEIVEDGNSFEENALIKARTVHNYLKNKNLDYLVMADDSGICCDALNGEPGIYSARYAGEHDDKANRKKLIKELEGKDKTAYFNCTIVLYYPNDNYKVFVGKTYGKIIEEEKGESGFGYDPIFYSNDLNKTFAEATEEEKNSVSHRGRALEKMKEEI